MGPGGGGVGISTGAGGGGVASGPAGVASEIAVAVCDFVSALCGSFAKCETGEIDIQCNFAQNQCVSYVSDLLVKNATPVTLPPGALAGIRCVSNVIRSSQCFFSKDFATTFEPQLRACGLPNDSFQQDSKTTTTPTTTSPPATP
jgi:hypothetical protein